MIVGTISVLGEKKYEKDVVLAIAKAIKKELDASGRVKAILTDDMTYERVVAKCLLPDGTDLSAALVTQGLALDWAKFSGGAYRHLEAQGVRKKLWRVDAKHKGRLKMDA